jgi:phospholipid/cholesterol/gamma-HCH transport system substrate-binding protein
VGLFVLIPALTVPALLLFTIAKSDLFQNWRTLYAVCENSEGLKKGNQVTMSGTAIGHVAGVDLVKEGKVQVSFNISGRYTRLVKSDTKARLKQRGFVGDWEIELFGGTAQAAEAVDGDTLKTEAVPSIDGLIVTAVGIIDTATALLNDVAAIVKGIKEGEGTVGQLFGNDTLFRNINSVSANALAATSNIRSLTDDIRGTLRGTDSLLATVTNLGRNGMSFVDTLSALINTANATVAQIGGILKNVKTASDDVPEIMNRLQRDLDEAEYMIKTLREGWLFKQMSGPQPKNPHLAETP